MAQKSGFFNALLSGGDYDRTYNANDYSDNLAVVISNGVLRTTGDDLRVTASGLTPSVAAGRAWIEGHYYRNTSDYTFAPVVAPTGGARYDRVMLRLNVNISVRSISLVYVEGTPSNDPVKPAPIRNDDIYDIVLADIYLAAGASNLVITDTRADAELCGWVYSTSGDNSFFKTLDNKFDEWFQTVKDELSSVTLFKRYTWSAILDSVTTQLAFSIPQYDEETCFIEVYVNGILDNRYTLAGNVITFAGSLVAGTVVIVKCYKSIDGTGIMTVADEITQLQNQYATLAGVSNFTYKCTGVDDNISLSQIAQAFYNKEYDADNVTNAAKAFLQALGGNEYLATLEDDFQATIAVVGNCVATSAFSGNGEATSRYKWFALGADDPSDKKLVFDFAKCNKITVECNQASTENIILYGTDLNVKNINIVAQSTSSSVLITMIAGRTNNGKMKFDDCRFIVACTGEAKISENGSFTNCYCYVKSNGGAAYCFKPRSAGLIRLINGIYFAYGLTTAGIGSAITHTSAGDTDGVLMAYNIHCPMVTLTDYTQSFLSVANAGNTVINGVVSRLTSSGSYNNITNQINKNKA